MPARPIAGARAARGTTNRGPRRLPPHFLRKTVQNRRRASDDRGARGRMVRGASHTRSVDPVLPGQILSTTLAKICPRRSITPDKSGRSSVSLGGIRRASLWTRQAGSQSAPLVEDQMSEDDHAERPAVRARRGGSRHARQPARARPAPEGTSLATHPSRRDWAELWNVCEAWNAGRRTAGREPLPGDGQTARLLVLIWRDRQRRAGAFQPPALAAAHAAGAPARGRTSSRSSGTSGTSCRAGRPP